MAVVRTDKEIVGGGVIKNPRPAYASKIARDSEFPFDKNMLELGYLAREVSRRGHNLSEKSVSMLLSALSYVPLYTTTSNEKMKETLKIAGFVQKGKVRPTWHISLSRYPNPDPIRIQGEHEAARSV